VVNSNAQTSYSKLKMAVFGALMLNVLFIMSLEGFVISGAEDLQNSPDKKNYASQQIHRNLVEKLDKISTESLDDTEEKLKVVQNKLKELEDDIKPFDNTWDNLLNQDNRKMVQGFTDDFGSLSSETAGNSGQPTDKTDIRDEMISTRMNNSSTPSVDMKSVFDEDIMPFHVSPGTSNHEHQRLPKVSQDVWPPLVSTILSEDIETHTQKHWWGVIKKTTADGNKTSLRKSAKDRMMRLLTCSSLRPFSS